MCCAQYYCPYLGQYVSWHKLFSVREEHVMYNNIVSCTGFCQVITWDNVLGPCICKCESLTSGLLGAPLLWEHPHPQVFSYILHPTYNIIISPPSSLNMKIDKLKVRDYLKATKGHHLDKSLWSANEKQWFFLVVTVLEVIVSWA
jgi:hypothetical protein